MPNQEATIFYGRLSGLADIIARDTDQRSSELIKEIFERTESAIQLRNGKILDFSGESFTVIFQDRKAQQNAVETVLECMESLNKIKKDQHILSEVIFKAGIAYAPVVIYKEKRKENLRDENNAIKVMGEAVDLAERLFAFADEGQILVNQAIYQHTSSEWHFNTLESIHIPGRKELLEVYELKEKKRKRLAKDPSTNRQIFSEMIGREDQVKIIEQKITELIAGKGSIISIIGEAGLGKSRLMAEMKVQSIMEKVLLLEGRAVSTGQNLSFHPISNLIKSWAEIKEDDLPSQSSEKLRMGIQRIAPEQADEIYAFLATMMGLPLQGQHKERVKGIEGEALEKLILKNLRDLVISATKDKPRIYVIEDMHWADSSSITLFESLYKLSRDYPVMFINVMRPGYKDTGDHILKYVADNFPSNHTNIHINPLEEEESSSLIMNLLRKTQLPEPIRNMIIRKTEGNPFFIEEIIRNFIDEGIIEAKEGHFTITEKINNVNIPETINDAILSRVDKLDEKTRELLNTASVMGRNFYYKVLEEATDTIEELDERLSYLTEVQLISESKKKQDIEYLFKHALSQQMTYDAMMQQSRKETHLKIARSIEKVFAANINEFYGTLVYHYQMAEDEEKTIYYLLLAGDEAMRSGASSEALRFFEKALDTLPSSRKDDPHDIEIRNLRINVANMYHATGRNFESIELFEFIFNKYFNYKVAKTEKTIMLRGVFGMLTIALAYRFPKLFFKKPVKQEIESMCAYIVNWASPIATVNPRHFVFKSSDAGRRLINYNIMSSEKVLEIYIQLAAVFMWASFSYPTVRRLIDLVDKAGYQLNPRPLVSLFMAKSMFDLNTGKWLYNIEPHELFDTGIKAGELWMTSVTAFYLGMQKVERGNYAHAVHISNKLDDLGTSFENNFAISQRYRLRSVAQMKFRKFDQLQELIDEAKVFFQSTDNKIHAVVLDLIQCQLHINNNNLKEAVISFEEAEAFLDKIKSIGSYHTQYLLTKIQLNLVLEKNKNNQATKKNKAIKELLKTSKKLISLSKKFVPNLTEAYILRANIFLFQHQFKKAFKNLQFAITTGEKHNSRIELSRAYFETGKFLADPANKFKELNGKTADHYLEKAREMFTEMELEWDLNEYSSYISKRS
jgi:class 3 adenylate cyclase/tetratricopeptide (TPR) repeat protein